MRLVIIEPEYHAEVLNNLCLLLQGSSIDTLIVTEQKIYRQLDFERIDKASFDWLVNPYDSSFEKFFTKNFQQIDHGDLIFFNTVSVYHKFFSEFSFSAKTVLRIHNAHTYFDPVNNISLKFSPYFIYKDLSHILRRVVLAQEVRFRRKLLSKVDYISLPDERIEEYCKRQGYLEKYELAPTIPLTFNQFSLEEGDTDKTIRITIPGTIDERRKDYLMVYEALTALKNKLTNPVELTLLGRPKGPYGKKVIRVFEKLASDNLKINTFTYKVSESIFIDIMRQTHFLILPLVKNTRFHIYSEQYGESKMSGAINDMIRFSKPALISDYPLNENLQKVSSIFRNSDDLKNGLQKWINNQEYLEKDTSVFHLYSLKNQQNRLEKVFKSLTD